MKKLRTIFMGTPDFAVACLQTLIDRDDVEVVGVVTQPDRPRGRGQKLMPSPVKVLAQNYSLPILQPTRLKNDNVIDQLSALKPDLIVVAAFGQILPQAVLDLPPLGCINVHASLLPRYRGAAPIEWCLINGETTTGITTMMMNAGLDTGDMLVKREVSIHDEMILPELYEALVDCSVEALNETLDRIIAGTLERVKQDDSQSNYAPMIKKDTGQIDWNNSARNIHNLVRGLHGRAYAVINDQKFKIWRTRIATNPNVELVEGENDCGKVLCADHRGLFVRTGEGIVEILELQAPNSKRMSATDYLKGHSIGR
ncbi:MAG: methionyl-tRNA formyltransferase [Selenomonadaceae bacterium]|nr:methionyl-tRNA formyltransferase [Selenomonadaceae bacterium]